jgi:hypothetical protein
MVASFTGTVKGIYEWMSFTTLVIIVVAILIIMGVVRARRQLRRAAALKQLADRVGWKFYSGFRKIESAKNRSVASALTADLDGQTWAFFEFLYEDDDGESPFTNRKSYFSVTLPTQFGYISIEKETAKDRLKSLVEGKDIQFDSIDFDNRFWVKGEFVREAKRFFTPKMRQHFLDGCEWRIQIEGEMLLLHADFSDTSVERFEQMREFMLGVVSILEAEQA